MSNSNPLQPQGSLLEQNLAGRSRIKWAVICVVGLHLVGLGALLMQGCKREVIEPEDAQPAVEESWYPPVPTNALPPVQDPVVADDPSIIPPSYESYTSAVPGEPMIPDRTSPPSTPPGTSGGTEYVVVRGDSFYSIGTKMGVSMKAIADANPNVDPNRLQIGQRLIIPAPAPTTPSATTPRVENGQQTYTVVSGDNLTKIADKHGTTIKALREANNLTTDLIKVGQVLVIPAPPQTESIPPALPPGRATPPPSF